MRNSSRSLVVAATLVTAQARFAHADDSSDRGGAEERDAKKERAKQHFLRGLEFAHKDQNYDAALAEFLASRELFPTQVALLNAAVSLTRLGRYDEALSMYQELFELFGPAMTAQERSLANEEMSDLESRLGSISVSVDVDAAAVEVDGRRRGVTPLPGALRVGPGTHLVRVSKPGFDPFETRLVVASQEQRELRATLVPSLARAPATPPAVPVPQAPPVKSGSTVTSQPKPRAFRITADVGLLWAPTFNGGAARACDSPPSDQGRTLAGCRDRKRPLGPSLRGSIGYEVGSGLELALTLGYLQAREAMTRAIVASGDRERHYPSENYRDSTDLSALTAAASFGYRVRLGLPFTLALGLGVARATLHHENLGTYAISVENPRQPGDRYQGSVRIGVPETDQALWLPLLAPELRVALTVSRRLSFDVGFGVLVLFGSSSLRSGSTSLSGEGERRTGLPEVPGGFADGSDVQPGVLALPQERRFGTVLAITPSLGGRFDL